MTAKNLCACSSVSAFDADENEYFLECNATTARTFAPGHDARLKGFLIRHGAAGNEVRYEEGGMAVSTLAEKVGDRYGFGHLVRAGIERAAAKEFAKILRQTAKKQAKPVIVQAKVGRWVREGVVTNGKFSYTEKSGKQISTTRYTQV